MTNAEGYNYDDFLSDSSDDYPKYADGIKQKKGMSFPSDFDGVHHVKQEDGDTNWMKYYENPYYDEEGRFEPYSTIINFEDEHHALLLCKKKPNSVLSALDKILRLAKEKLREMQEQRKSFEDTLLPLGHELSPPKDILDLEESIKIIDNYIMDSNIALAKADKK